MTTTAPLKVGDQRTLTATAVSHGTITMKVDAGSAPVCALSGSGPWTLTAQKPGTCVVRGSVSATNYAPLDATTTMTVASNGETVRAPSSTDSIRSTTLPSSLTLRVAQKLTLLGTSASGAGVVFSLTPANSLIVCSLTDTVLTANGPGQCFLQATTNLKNDWRRVTEFYTLTVTPQ